MERAKVQTVKDCDYLQERNKQEGRRRREEEKKRRREEEGGKEGKQLSRPEFPSNSA